MDWIQSLLWDSSSVAHIVFLYAFVIAAGVLLGKIKIFGVSIGSHLCSVHRYSDGTFRFYRRHTHSSFHPRVRIDLVVFCTVFR